VKFIAVKYSLQKCSEIIVIWQRVPIHRSRASECQHLLKKKSSHHICSLNINPVKMYCQKIPHVDPLKRILLCLHFWSDKRGHTHTHNKKSAKPTAKKDRRPCSVGIPGTRQLGCCQWRTKNLKCKHWLYSS